MANRKARLTSIWIAMRADDLDWFIPSWPSRAEAAKHARLFSKSPPAGGHRWRAVRYIPTVLGHYRRAQ